ncbi:MAG: hypothetical protein FWC50_14840, partial [Planctomycetaceae bacterium]|nr:hypothetical protein [Planctomycetaceae bacterium]
NVVLHGGSNFEKKWKNTNITQLTQSRKRNLLHPATPKDASPNLTVAQPKPFFSIERKQYFDSTTEMKI